MQHHTYSHCLRLHQGLVLAHGTWKVEWHRFCSVTCFLAHARPVWAPGSPGGLAGSRYIACSGQMQGTDSPSLAPQDPLDSCEAIVGAAQPRRAARAQVNNPDASYVGMSPVARRVLFGASGEEAMPGERGNTMAMSELVVTCLSTTLSCYLVRRPVPNTMAMSELVVTCLSTTLSCYLLRSPALWDTAQADACSLSCVDRLQLSLVSF